MKNNFPSWWLKNSWQSILLTPFSWLFWALSTLRKIYQLKWATPHRSPLPVIIVGNIMIGGTGKTPMVLYMAKLCRSLGLQPAIISKGYGGTHTATSKEVLLVNPEHGPKEVGDEPLMMACAAVAPVAICYQRIRAIKWLAEHYPQIDCIISDDGLNDYSVLRDIEIVMIDGMRGLGNQKMIPAGPLSESPKRLSSSDINVITKPKGHLCKAIKSHASMSLLGEMAINMYSQEKRPLSFFADKNPLAIAGIGNPERYFNHLRKYIPNVDTKSFPDHYDYSQSEDLPADRCLLMTSKDAIKLRDTVADNYWEVPVEAVISPSFDRQVSANLEKAIKKARLFRKK